MGSCVVSLPFFANIVAETARLIEDEVFASEGAPAIFSRNLVTAKGGSQVAEWIEETIDAQIDIMSDSLIRSYLGGVLVTNPVVAPWSVCVVPVYAGMTDYEGFGLITVVILDLVVVRPVGKIVAGLKSHLARWKRTVENAEDLSKSGDCKDECWLCLETFNSRKSNMLWNSDYFCCGHLVCPSCTNAAAALRQCGVCRAAVPPDDGLEARILERARRGGDPREILGSCLTRGSYRL
jgi:hypothetical protein